MELGILIIEDNSITRKMLRVSFEGEGFKVWEADSGQAALALAQSERPPLIVQDLLLPDTDGFELVKRLRALPATANVPILCYSGLVGADDAPRVLAAGFTDFVLKPAPGELVKVARTYIESQPSPVAARFIGRHILVVDDDPMLRKLTTLRLHAAGARVTLAEHGNDALAKARAEPPDAILSDVLMPECDGFALCQAVRQDPALTAIPVVLMSSQYVDDDNRKLARQLGVNALIARSADLETAMAALTESLTQWAVPQPTADPTQLQAAHLGFVAHRRQIDQAHATHTQTLYGILANFLEQVADVQTRGGELTSRLDEVLKHYLDACGYPSGAIYLFESHGELKPHAMCGVPRDCIGAWMDFFKAPATLARVMQRSTPTAVGPDDPDAVAVLRAAEAEFMVLCPLQLDDKPLGVLVLCSKRRQVEPEWLALAQAAARPISQAIAFTRTLAALTASEQRFRGVAESLADGVIITDEAGGIVYANGAVAALFGEPAESLRGRQAERLSSLFVCRAGVWAGRVTHRDGRRIPVNGSTAVVLDPEYPDRLTYTHVLHDLSAKEHLEQLRHLADHDPLTQMYNRRVFEAELATRLNEARRYAVRGAVLLLDLDHFKQINDTLGHAAGDAALVAFAQILREATRPTDVLARMGGDEFAILAPYAHCERAEGFARKLLQQLSAHPAQFNGQTLPMSASIGVACYDKSTSAPAELLVHADRALYQAKHAGRGCYRLYQQDIE